MTQKEKQLLLKDLSARLPYCAKCHFKYGTAEDVIILKCIDGDTARFNYGWYGEFHVTVEPKYIKPYLRPMSSMTKEEIEKYIRLRHKDCIDVEKPTHCCKNSITAVVVTLTSRESMRYWYNDMVSSNTIDFLNERYLDWRGLIPLGLALEAPDNMYN